MTALSGPPWGATSLQVTFGDTIALDGVSATAVPGRVTAVVGGDGAGKTTLLRCLAGALRPDSGEVTTPGPLRSGYLPASSGVYPDLTVVQNLAFRATAYGMSKADTAQRIAELTEQAGLATARDRLAGQLSGGMRQKLGVIAALLHKPDMLILDEPSTGVDPVSRSGLWWLIASAAAEGAAVILTTTYIDDAQRAGSVLVLDSGQALAAGSPDEIVAAVPGSLVTAEQQPEGAAGKHSWRRGSSWRLWCPPGTTVPGEPIAADLQDAVTIAALARDPDGGAPQPAPAKAGPTRTPPPGRLAECVGVTRMFGDFTAVREVSVGVRAGEIVGLLGANGAGKTTLIRMLLGLIPPSSGQVMLLGEPPSRRTRSRIGYVPQGLGLYDDLTATENLDFAAAVFGGERAVLPDDVRQRSGTPVGMLPLGLQRRIAFAQALAHDPDLLILDEPTSGVDPLGRARLWQTIAAAARAGAGVLVSTHYMEEAGECDRLVIMADGEVVAEGPADQIIAGAVVTVVDADDWAAAFGQLERAGIAVSLAGRSLRVPGASPAQVREALADGPAEVIGQRIFQAPATLEEKFFELVLGRATDATDQVPA